MTTQEQILTHPLASETADVLVLGGDARELLEIIADDVNHTTGTVANVIGHALQNGEI